MEITGAPETRAEDISGLDGGGRNGQPLEHIGQLERKHRGGGRGGRSGRDNRRILLHANITWQCSEKRMTTDHRPRLCTIDRPFLVGSELLAVLLRHLTQ